MKTKTVSLVILGLCLLSIIVGALNINKKEEVKKISVSSEKSAFFKKFSSTGDKIALVSLQGIISSDESGSLFGDVESAGGVLKNLERACDDSSVKGVIIRINSPGGTVAMSEEIHDVILKLREKKPVVVSMADVAASGGYFIASAADRIYASPGTLTGSIGVIMETMDASKLLSGKLGIESDVIKSGKFKDTGSLYRPMRDDEKKLLGDLVNNAYKQFLGAITDGRINRKDNYKEKKIVLTKETLEKYADGRVLSGEQALAYGFVDKLGGLAIAEEEVVKMAKEKFPFISNDIPVINYNRPTGFDELFYSFSNKLVLPVKGIESFMPLSKKYSKQPLFVWE